MTEVFKHALGICGDHWHPNLLTLLLGGVGISTIYSYVILYLKHAFHDRAPFPSFTLNQTTFQWEPPIPYPSSGDWKWDEAAYQADNTKGWIVEP